MDELLDKINEALIAMGLPTGSVQRFHQCCISFSVTTGVWAMLGQTWEGDWDVDNAGKQEHPMVMPVRSLITNIKRLLGEKGFHKGRNLWH